MSETKMNASQAELKLRLEIAKLEHKTACIREELQTRMALDAARQRAQQQSLHENLVVSLTNSLDDFAGKFAATLNDVVVKIMEVYGGNTDE